MIDTKAKELIVQAFSEGGFTARAGSTIAEEMQEALPRLNSLLFSLLGYELGEQYTDWPVPHPSRTSSTPARYPRDPLAENLSETQYVHPPANSRIIAKNTSVVTAYFPESPSDGARMAYADVGATANITFDGNGRTIQGVASVEGSGGTRRWFYRADLGDWICLDPLQMDDYSPLPLEFDDLLIAGLVIRLSARFGKEPSAVLAGRYTDMLSRLRARYRQVVEDVAARPNVFPVTRGAQGSQDRPWSL